MILKSSSTDGAKLSNWEIEYWIKDKKFSPLEEWLNHRTHEQFKYIAKEMALLAQCGNKLRLPHSRALGDGLFELRERNYGYRIYYTFLPDKKIILLQAGDKKTQKKDIKIAIERLNELGVLYEI